MRLLYSIGIHFLGIAIKIMALFNSKLKLGVNGRNNTFLTLKSKIKPTDKTFWFHCASLGEYEQGLPVFEAIKQKYPNYKVVLSFFSPSGYEVRKNSKIADVVVYLPLDTMKNAKAFLNIVNPDFTIFVKYEIWPNFLNEINKRNLNAILISAVFRKSQSFFKWYGSFMKSALEGFNYIFTQDSNSETLLKSINLNNVSVSGDTRFDRVYNQLSLDNTVPFIETFKNKEICVVFGSTWPADDKLYLDFINSSTDNTKYIIAPHNIKSSYITSLTSQIKQNVVCFSNMEEKDLSKFKVFILDTIGYLSKVYAYADIAYVGGATGTTGLHNILEPATFGIPIIIGKNHSKFPEAKTLINIGGVLSVASSNAFENSLQALISNQTIREDKGILNKAFVEENKGAVIQILNNILI